MPLHPLDDRQRRDWLRLAKSEHVGPVTFHRLIARYGEAATALEALPELSRRGGLARPIRLYPSEAAEADLDRADDLGARFIAACEPDYPALLRQTDSAPALICIKGDADMLQRPMIAMVGARNASAAGRRMARDMASALGRAGLVVISGLARGIDTAAHQAALDTGTVAVLAGGMDVIYPPENADLHHAIAERGCLVSEMTPGTMPRAEHFPRRNRLIAGMSLGTLVVEAALRSGSLITSRLALEQNREVFAIPGSPLDPRAAGTNRLIKQGATLVTSAEDVIEAMSGLIERADRFDADDIGLDDPEGDADFEASDGDQRDRLWALLGSAPVELDDLIRESGLPARIVNGMVMELEMAGRLERYPGQRVAKLP
jgi:DNA processing protein